MLFGELGALNICQALALVRLRIVTLKLKQGARRMQGKAVR